VTFAIERGGEKLSQDEEFLELILHLFSFLVLCAQVFCTPHSQLTATRGGG